MMVAVAGVPSGAAAGAGAAGPGVGLGPGGTVRRGRRHAARPLPALGSPAKAVQAKPRVLLLQVRQGIERFSEQ